MLGMIYHTIEQLWTALVSFIEYATETFSSLGYLISMLNTFVENMPQYLDWLPLPALQLICIGFVVVILYKILGREG